MLQYCALAEVPGFSPAQLEALTLSIEQKKQKLEDEINTYIRRKQDDLRRYERELLEDYRSMERAASITASEPPTQLTDQSQDSTKNGPGDTAKRTKHTRVHKREKELCGLVTPIFLPLLEAGTSPIKRKKEKWLPVDEESASNANTPTNLEKDLSSRDAERDTENRRSRSKNTEDLMEHGEGSVGGDGLRDNQRENQKESHKPEIVKKKRAAVKKSSLRHTSAPRARRKRVSLVIDDQIVLPADNIAEPPLTSSETTASTDSTSNSTASLEDSIDPRLISPTTPSNHHEHQDPVHHSLSLPTALPSASPTKHTGHILSESPPQIEYEPPQTTTSTFLDPSPAQKSIIPQFASPTPIYASQPDIAEAEEEGFSTYVGGISGSGVDDVDQAGSYGYPSSLGASYLESYMKSRPLSVRVASAEKAELEDEEKRALVNGEMDMKEDTDLDVGRVDDADEDFAVMGGMEDF